MSNKKLLVKEPVTYDGVSPVFDDNGKKKYNTSIVELGSKKLFESLNAKIKTGLKLEFEEIEVEDKKNVIALKVVPQEVVDEKDKEIEALKAQLAASKTNADDKNGQGEKTNSKAKAENK